MLPAWLYRAIYWKGINFKWIKMSYESGQPITLRITKGQSIPKELHLKFSEKSKISCGL